MMTPKITTAQWNTMREPNTNKIKELWNELTAVQRTFSDCGANDSEVDWKLQSLMYAMSFDVPVDVPRTPKRYQLLVKDGNSARAFECAKEFHRILKLIQVEFRPFGSGLLPDALYEWVLVTCWRFCQRP